jgi:hypothetical protein
MNHGPSLKSLQTFKKDIKKEINSLRRNRDLQKFLSKFNTQKKLLEKKVKKDVQTEIQNANKFLEARKKELNDFQKKVKLTIKRKAKKKMHS